MNELGFELGYITEDKHQRTIELISEVRSLIISYISNIHQKTNLVS